MVNPIGVSHDVCKSPEENKYNRRLGIPHLETNLSRVDCMSEFIPMNTQDTQEQVACKIQQAVGNTSPINIQKRQKTCSLVKTLIICCSWLLFIGSNYCSLVPIFLFISQSNRICSNPPPTFARQSALVDLWIRKGSHSARHTHGRPARLRKGGRLVLVMIEVAMI